MEVVRGEFILPSGATIYIPDRKIVNNGWGELGSTHIIGEETKPVPVRLRVAWFSYTEDRFYAGDFILPVQALTEQFIEGFRSPISGEAITYDRLVVGLAPGGVISLWISGLGVVREVAFFQADPVLIPWKAIVPNETLSREEYIQIVKNEVGKTKSAAEVRKMTQTQLWSSYRQSYAWELVVAGARPHSVWIRFFNGEREHIDFSSQRHTHMHVIPKSMQFTWYVNEQGFSATIDFEESEIFRVFEELCPGDRRINLEIKVVLGPRVRVEVLTQEPPAKRAWLNRLEVQIFSLE